MWGHINQDPKSYFTQPAENFTQLFQLSSFNWNLNRDYPGKDQWDASCSRAGHDLWHSWHTCHWPRPEQDWCPRCYAGEWNCRGFTFAFLQPRGCETCPGAGATQNQQVQVTERRSPTEHNTSADLQGTGPGRPPSNLLLLMGWLEPCGGDVRALWFSQEQDPVLLETSCLLSALCGSGSHRVSLFVPPGGTWPWWAPRTRVQHKASWHLICLHRDWEGWAIPALFTPQMCLLNHVLEQSQLRESSVRRSYVLGISYNHGHLMLGSRHNWLQALGLCVWGPGHGSVFQFLNLNVTFSIYPKCKGRAGSLEGKLGWLKFLLQLIF